MADRSFFIIFILDTILLFYITDYVESKDFARDGSKNNFESINFKHDSKAQVDVDLKKSAEFTQT